MKIVKGYFSTSDLGFTASLLHLGYELKNTIYEQEGTKHIATFLFSWDTRLKDLQDDYYNGRLRVEPFSYNMNLKDVKGRIINHRRMHDA